MREQDWIKFWGILITTVGLVLITAINQAYRENRMFIERGYTQKTLPGYSFPRWVKE